MDNLTFTQPFRTSDERRAVLRLRDVGVIPSLMSMGDSIKYAREHNMITPYLVTEAVLKEEADQRTTTQMPNAAILPGAVKGDGEWVVEALHTLLNDLMPKLAHIRYRAEKDGEEEAQELAAAVFYTARVGCDNLEIIMEDTARHD